MRRFLLVLLLQASLLLTGCGQVFVGFVSNPQLPSSSVSGIVIVVHLESANDTSGPVTFTAVTFSSGGLSNSVNFCGDQQSRFPLKQSLRADFHPGTVCSTLVTVVIL